MNANAYAAVRTAAEQCVSQVPIHRAALVSITNDG